MSQAAAPEVTQVDVSMNENQCNSCLCFQQFDIEIKFENEGHGNDLRLCVLICVLE
jgi:hypothetical protein